MTPSWTERSVLPSDTSQIATHACYREEDRHRRAGYAEWLTSRIAAGRYIGLLALREGEVIGGAGVVLLDWGPTRANPGGLMGRVANVFVDPQHRSQGIARSLVANVMARCEAMGVREFNLGAMPEARELYRSLGFIDYPAEMRRRV
ncbi:GNAT family N-acetyltransferase [Roseateles chitinivorans]|uniref:GNAT family N-acetyltransferase n=1 Tax=Roseateles chitinivorans TaxID=2917965 RepID=UPI003D66E546